MKKRLCILLITLLTALALSTAASAGETSGAGQVWTTSGRLNVRSGPSTAAAVVSQLPRGSYVTLEGLEGSWFRVEYARGQYGYCHANHIAYVDAAPASVTTNYSALNVRSGPGTGYGKTDTLTKGTPVQVLSSGNGWSRILYHGTKTGYVSAQYLSNSGAISLSVPSYKQTDPRWAEVTLGSSGKTMGKIGCATTAIAMVESWRTGRTIYPHTMASALSYTPSGSVYWPAHYTPVTSSANYLSNLLAQLRQGKPVLFGGKNAYGSQHWVVVTGFTGGALTAANFTIHDPGSNSRTTLAQFLMVYPTFYKYFTY